MQPELNNTKIIFLHSAAWTAKCSTCLHVHIFCMNVLFKMSTIRHQHLWGGRKHRSSSLVLFIPLKHFLDQGSARSHQKVTPAGGHFSLTDRFCVGTTTTPSPRDVPGPGELTTIHGTTQILLQSFFCTYAHRGQAAGHEWLVYFWMYSLHSERVAVGTRQLWRQRVIVARQPDRSKMAELTGTGVETSRTLAVFGKFSLLATPLTPHQTHLMMIIYPTETTIRRDGWQKNAREREREHKRARRRKRLRDLKWRIWVFSAFALKQATSDETATKQSWQSHTLPQRNNKQQLESAREKLWEKEKWEGKKWEMDRVKRNYFFGEVTMLNLPMLREQEVYLMALYVWNGEKTCSCHLCLSVACVAEGVSLWSCCGAVLWWEHPEGDTVGHRVLGFSCVCLLTTWGRRRKKNTDIKSMMRLLVEV